MNRCVLSRFLFLVLVLLLAFWSPVFAQKGKRQSQRSQAARQSDMSQAEYYLTEGMKFYILDNYTKAVDYFQKALEADPQNAAASYAIAESYIKMKRYGDAIPYAEKALAADANNKHYHLTLGELYEKDRRLPQALKTYQDLIKLAPQDPKPYLDLAAIYLQQEKYEDAVKTYDRIEKLIGVNEEVVLQKQQLYLKLNKVDAAVAEGKKLVEAFPGESRYLIFLAEIYNANKRTDEAIPLIEKAMANGAGNAQLRLVLSDLYRTKGQVQKADQELEAAFGNAELSADIKVQILADYVKSQKEEQSRKNALKLADLIIKSHPQNAKAHAVYGDLLVFSDQKLQARNQYLTATKLDNSIFEAWQQLVRLDAELGHNDSLTKHAEQALELFPNQSVFWYFSGYAYLAGKDYMKAIDALEEGRRLSVGNQELLNDYNAMLGDAYNATGEYVQSDAAYQSVLEKDPDNAAVLNNYSYFLALRGEKLEQAKQMAAKLVEKHPDNPTYLDTYAWVLYTLKDYQQARKYLEKAAAKGSENGTILEHYGDVLYKLGESEKALQVWQQAKRIGRTSEKLDQKIAQKKLYE